MKYLNARIDDNIFGMFNLACAEMGKTKQGVIQDLVTMFIEEKENMENAELEKLADSRYKSFLNNPKTKSLADIRKMANV